MKLKNISARAYGVFGKIIAPMQEFEISDAQESSVIDIIEAGDFEIIESKESDESDTQQGQAKRGRPSKQKE